MTHFRMKNPALEKKIQAIEGEEKKRRIRAARFGGKKRKQEGGSRKAVIKRMITKAKQDGYARDREARRPTFGTGLARDHLIRPQL